MSEEHSIKNLVSRTASDAWNAVLGRRPESYQIPEVGYTLMGEIDYAVFERRLAKAVTVGVVFEKWAEKDLHFACKAPAVMSTVFSIGGMRTVAEEKIIEAKKKLKDCKDCRAHYLKRNGIYLIYDEQPTAALFEYTQAIALFRELGDDFERAKCLINRGVVKSIMQDFESGLADEETALDILGTDSGHYIVISEINRAAILTKMERRTEAREKVEEAQDLLSGIKKVERPKLILRWIRALLLEGTGEEKDRKLAGQMLYRVERRMHDYSMQREIRVLLADRARVAKSTHTIKEIAHKALTMEDSPRIQQRIQTVIANPTKDNILKWRNELDSYVPPFCETA